MEAYADWVEDLQRTEPAELPPLIPLYLDTDTFDIQFSLTYASLQRNTKLKERTMALLDAYFLGRLLNSISDRWTRVNYCRMLTIHYRTIAENAFDIFEGCPDQIQRTQVIDAQRLRRLPRQTVKTLRGIVLAALAGARN